MLYSLPWGEHSTNTHHSLLGAQLHSKKNSKFADLSTKGVPVENSSSPRTANSATGTRARLAHTRF